MIIKIIQTSSNIKQEYDIEFPESTFFGSAGNVSALQHIEIFNKDTNLSGKFQISNWVNYIPLRYLFGVANLTRAFLIERNEEDIGEFIFSKHGFMKSFYVITLNDDTILHCYTRMKGSYNYISVYNGDDQIALIETYLCCNDYKYKHKIYLLDDWRQLCEVLSLFVLYYASFKFAHRMHMSSGSSYEKGFSLSKYNNKYNPCWRELNFPDENFFGKTSLFKV